MPTICLYFQVHLPYWISGFTFFDIGKRHGYFDDRLQKEHISKVADQAYLPANNLLKKLINEFPDTFKVAFSFSGTALTQFQQYRPDVLESFRNLINTGNVEILGSPFYHSLSSIKDTAIFKQEIQQQENFLYKLFGVKPQVFANSEMVFSNKIAEIISELGYKGILTDADKDISEEYPSSELYHTPGSETKILLRNAHLCDNLLHNFSFIKNEQFPVLFNHLSQWKFSKWTEMHQNPGLINLFFDYSSFGYHINKDTGILNFLYQFPQYLLKNGGFNFNKPSDIFNQNSNTRKFKTYKQLSWSGNDKNLRPWMHNPMQEEALNKIYSIKDQILKTGNPTIINEWYMLQTADHFFNMGTQSFNSILNTNFSYYNSPYDAYIYFMNIYSDLELKIKTENISL